MCEIPLSLVINSPSTTFSDNCLSQASELAERFIQSVADISINELKIHFLGSTKVDLDEPYKELNKAIFKQTKQLLEILIFYRKFYQDAAKVLQIEVYKETIDKDFEMMSRTVLPITLKEMSQLRQSYMEKYLRHYIKRRFDQFIKKTKNLNV